MGTKDKKFTAKELEVLKWLEGQPRTEEILEKTKGLEPIDWSSEPEFVANFARGMVTEDILAAMEEEKINQSQLAGRLGKSRQYVSKVLNETANFTIDSLAEIAVALNRKIEVRMIGKTRHVFISEGFQPVDRRKYAAVNSSYNMKNERAYAADTGFKVAEPQAEYNAKKEKDYAKEFTLTA